MLTQTGNKMKVFRSDNGTEYTSEEFNKYTKKRGILVIQEFSSPYIHEQNGRAEQEIRTITESARSILNRSIDVKLWTETVNTACYVLNRVILQQSETRTPFEKWFNRKPEIKHLRVFGTQAFINIPKEKRKKFDPKSKKVIVVGYDGESSNYRLWDNKANRIYISSNVDFNENSSQLQEKNENNSFCHEISFGTKEDDQIADHPVIDQEADQDDDQNDNQEIEVPKIPDQNAFQGKQLRDRRLLNAPQRYGCPVAYVAESTPVNFNEAISSPDSEKWQRAIQEEMDALEENNTWNLVSLPQGKRPIGSKWVFTIKNSNRYKARLVAKGFSQREGIDYFETFAPVVRYESIRILLSIAAKEDYEIAKFDVKTAFLNGDLQEEIYLQIPDGYVTEETRGLVYKLRRSLYGLKQSPRCWNEKFVGFLRSFNFKNIESDKCVFVGVVSDFKVYLALYVDDGLIICESQSAIDKVLNYLKSNFQITVDKATEFVGIEIERNRAQRTIKVSQSSYIEKVITKFGMENANPSSVPAEPGSHLSKIESKECKNECVPYREAVGSLLFAARVCRPDIEYAVNYASQFLDSFGQEHWIAVKKIIRYLIGTRTSGIVFGSSGSSLNLVGFTDADYAGCLETRKSRSGFVFLLNNGPISWSSQRQNVVSLSTTEAEYIALAHGAKEAVWLRRMLSELNVNCGSVPIFVDNQSAIKLANNSEFHKRSKHIDIRFHFIRDMLSRKEIEIHYVQSKEQLADILTKPLPKQ